MNDLLHRYVLHNLGLKLVSLALAMGLWLAVTRDPVAEVAVEVPIEFRQHSAEHGDQFAKYSQSANPAARAGASYRAGFSPPTFTRKSSWARAGLASAPSI